MNNELGIKVNKKITTFTDLNAWKESHKLVLIIYKITRTFPKEELFGLVTQMRRCVVSITSNVAEGFSRQSYKEKLQFYSIALGSLAELQNQLIVARDVGYIHDGDYAKVSERTVTAHKLINGLIKASKAIIHNS